MKKSLLAIFMIVGLAGAFDAAPSIKVGYVYSSLKATQSGALANSVNGTAAGAEFAFDMNFYVGESSRWGWSVGLGTELLGISWDKLGLYGWQSVSTAGSYTDQDYFASDFLWTLTPNVGIFGDVFRSESGSLRVKLFANIGVSLDMLVGGIYDGVRYSGGTTVEVPVANVAATMPLSVGARFHFAKKTALSWRLKRI